MAYVLAYQQYLCPHCLELPVLKIERVKGQLKFAQLQFAQVTCPICHGAWKVPLQFVSAVELP